MATWAADTDSCGSYGGGSAGGEDGPGCSLLEAFEDFEAQVGLLLLSAHRFDAEPIDGPNVCQSECRTAALIAAADQEVCAWW